MSRGCVALCVSLWLAAGAGCRMCSSPYDYCGPTYGVENCDDGCGMCGNGCSMTDRRGSILSQGGCGDCGSGDCGVGNGDGYYAEGYGTTDPGTPIYEGVAPPEGQALPADEPAPAEMDDSAYQAPGNPAQPIYRGATRPNGASPRLRPVPDPRMSHRLPAGHHSSAMMMR